MTTTPTFGTRLIGQTEKALNAILGRLLVGSGVSEPQWVALNLAAAGDGKLSTLVDIVGGVLKVDAESARARIAELVDRQLVGVSGDDTAVHVTAEGRNFLATIRGSVGQVTDRLWGDVSDEELTIAARVLGTVLERTNAELASL